MKYSPFVYETSLVFRKTDHLECITSFKSAKLALKKLTQVLNMNGARTEGAQGHPTIKGMARGRQAAADLFVFSLLYKTVRNEIS